MENVRNLCPAIAPTPLTMYSRGSPNLPELMEVVWSFSRQVGRKVVLRFVCEVENLNQSKLILPGSSFASYEEKQRRHWKEP